MIHTLPYRAAFVSDLDGTLLRDPHGISPDDYTALAGLAEKRIVRVLATGRAVHSLRHCLAADFPIDYVLASSGNQILHWQTQQLTHSSSLSVASALHAQNILVDLGLCFMAHRDFPDNRACICHYGPIVPEDFKKRVALYAASSSEGKIDTHWTAVSQFVVITEHVQDVERVCQALPDFSVIRATSPLDGQSVWIEIFAAQVSKAHALDRLMTELGFAHKPLAAIGNDFNDIDMLDMVQYPYIVPGARIVGPHYLHIPPQYSSAVAYAIRHFTKAIQDGWHDA
ncbi:hypothetical protein MASR1M90_20660 [Desulfovibrionales bacterium]